jgi:hypothetical protein
MVLEPMHEMVRLLRDMYVASSRARKGKERDERNRAYQYEPETQLSHRLRVLPALTRVTAGEVRERAVPGTPPTPMRPAGIEPAAYGSGGHRSIP